MNRKVIIIGIIIIVILLGAVSFFIFKSQTKITSSSCNTGITGALSDEKAGVWFNNYYTNPQPELTVQAINSFIVAKKFDDPKLQTPFITFFSEIFKQNPASLDKWIMQDLCGLNESETRTWDVLTTALRISNTAEAKQVLLKIRENVTDSGKSYIDDLLNVEINDSMNPKAMKITSAGDLDAMWAGFFASGDQQYVKQVISALDYLDTSKYGNVVNGETMVGESFITGQAAEWSLTSNAQQHTKVMEILKDEASKTTDSWLKTELEKIISDALNPKQ